MSQEFEIDIHRLHIEWQKQVARYHEYATKLADADTEVDRMKGFLELTEARMELEIRDNPSAFGLRKVTEASVEKTVIASAEYQTALLKHNQARGDARFLRGVINTLDQRKTAIEYITKLRLADYFAEPRVPGEARESGNERLRKEATTAVTQRKK